MKTIFVIAVVAMLTLLNAVVAAAFPLVASSPSGSRPDIGKVNVCKPAPSRDLCRQDTYRGCSQCARYLASPTSPGPGPNKSVRTVIPQNGAPVIPTPVKKEAETGLRWATDEEIDAVNAALTKLMEETPVPSFERDRMGAEILREHGFLVAEVELLQGIVEASTIVNPEDVAAIQSAYAFMGLPDIAVDYGDWLNQNLPAYQIPVVDWYFDPNTIVRQSIADYGVDYFRGVGDVRNATRYEVWGDNLQGQLDTSLLEGAVLIQMP